MYGKNRLLYNGLFMITTKAKFLEEGKRLLSPIIPKKNTDYLIAIGLTLMGALLRLYAIRPFLTFLGDQGRDVMIMKRIIMLQHFPAVGAPTSIGLVYLGPFYYYFMSPWLLLSRFDPVGPAIGVAVLSTLALYLGYVAVRDMVSREAAILTTGLMALSGSLVMLERFSWNPNLLPITVLALIITFASAITRRKSWLYFTSGILFAICTQLHYVSLVLAGPIGLVALYELCTKRPILSCVIKKYFIFTVAVVLMSLPLFLFDLKHGFQNAQNFIGIFTKDKAVTTDLASKFVQSSATLARFGFIELANPTLVVVLSLILIGYALFLLARDTNVLKKITGLFYIFAFLGLTSLAGQQHIHYLTHLYTPFYLLVGFLITDLLSRIVKPKTYQIGIIFLILAFFGYSQRAEYRFFFEHPSNQIDRAKHIAAEIEPQITAAKYQLTGTPNQYADSMYRYFLELHNKPAMEKDSPERADELFVVCEGECQLIGNAQWDIALFAPTKVVSEKQVEGVKIYKLIREEAK